MTSVSLRRMPPESIPYLLREPVSRSIEQQVTRIIDEVRDGGEPVLRRWAIELGDLQPADPLTYAKADLLAAAKEIAADRRDLLLRCAQRIRTFAEAQLASLHEVRVPLPGGAAGHWITPVESAGCYAPGGRFPLLSTVLMTVVTARAAGVSPIWVASPRPGTEILAAAAMAGADGVLGVGGAQAIAALTFGIGGVPRCHLIVGPGNCWVTASKKVLGGVVGIDMLAGPTELVILADNSAEPDLVAADLLAQAEHDPEALPVLVSTSPGLLEKVDDAVQRQLQDLPTREIAQQALRNGFAVLAKDLDQAISICDRLAPEHLQVVTSDAQSTARRCRHYGAMFIGNGSAEVLGDYCAGPNHTLPTGGSARFIGGLSVLSFLRVHTWLQIDDASRAEDLYADAVALARIEGLDGHARAAALRGGN